jgi:hypothetical protein
MLCCCTNPGSLRARDAREQWHALSARERSPFIDTRECAPPAPKQHAARPRARIALRSARAQHMHMPPRRPAHAPLTEHTWSDGSMGRSNQGDVPSSRTGGQICGTKTASQHACDAPYRPAHWVSVESRMSFRSCHGSSSSSAAPPAPSSPAAAVSAPSPPSAPSASGVSGMRVVAARTGPASEEAGSKGATTLQHTHDGKAQK